MAFFTFSSGDYSRREQLEAAQDIYGAMAKVDLAVPRGEAPDISARIRLLPGVSIALVRTSTLIAQRGARQVADGNDDLSLLLNPHGQGGWIARQREEIACDAGSGCLARNDQPGRVDFCGAETHFLSIAFSRSLLEPMLADVDRASRDRLHTGEPLRHLTRLVLGVMSSRGSLAPQEAPGVADRLVDLAALALGARREAQRLARGRGLREARLRAIKADMSVLAAQGDIALHWIAARHGVSPSYVRALFRHAGTSFTDYLLEQRLQRAFERLADPRHAATSISAIAYESGFNNLSWFYRAFKQRFAMAPGEVRDPARIPLAGPTARPFS